MLYRNVTFVVPSLSRGARGRIPRWPVSAFSTTTAFRSTNFAGRGVARALQDTSPKPSSTLFTEEFSLKDKVALVTGANSALGLESALALAEAGARTVYCVDIVDAPGPDWLKARDYVSRLHGDTGSGRLEYIRCDVSDQEKMLQVGQAIGDWEGRMDICLAAAAINIKPLFSLDVPDGVVQKILDVNFKGCLYTAQAAGQQMLRFGTPGSIMLISSVAGHITLPDHQVLPYSASKAALLQMARSLAGELAPHGVRANSISAGWFKTPMTAPLLGVDGKLLGNVMARMAEPAELRGTVVWLASDASSFVTGIDIEVSGGHTIC